MRGTHVVRILILVVVALAIPVAAGCGGEGGDGTAEQSAAARRAWDRLDDRMTNIFNRTDQTVAVPWNCMARASQVNAYGGPALAKCVPVAERAAAKLRGASERLGNAYRSSPAYLRRIYRSAYRAEQDVLAQHARYLDAMAQWGRVHGASSYQGAAEFDAIKAQRSHIIASDDKWDRRMDQARDRWERYHEQRWES